MSNTTAAMDARLVVRDVIQRVYGDATQTVLDDRAASEIVAALREMGWASIDEVGRLIAAAGGEVTISDRLMLSGEEYVVTKEQDFRHGGFIFRSRLAR